MTRSLTLNGLSVVCLAALTACGGGQEAYYPSGVTVQVLPTLEPDFEPGNAGGQEVTISGANFGDDPTKVVVLLDNHNAEVLSVTNNEIVIRTPEGPITGGPVDVLVATPNGYARLEPNGDLAPYTYGAGVFDGDGDVLKGNSFYRDQRHYIQVSNLWDSCYGGRGIPACANISINGETGTAGQGEFFQFPYPRLHTTQIGWLTAFDVSPGEWAVRPATAAFPSGIDGLRKAEMEPFALVNPVNSEKPICVNMSEEDVLSRTVDCSQARFDTREYDLGRLEFCEVEDQETGGTGDFRADWPVQREFFEPDAQGVVNVTLESFELQVIEDLVLPPPLVVGAEKGFNVRPTDPSVLLAPVETCTDGNDDGDVTFDEEGIVLTWEPLATEFLSREDVNTYIHVSVTAVNFTWYGLEQQGIRATVVVPDRNEAVFDEETGLWTSRVSIPNSILYQIPTVESSYTEASDFGAFLGDYDSNAGLLWMEIYRVSDYQLDSNDGQLIFSYSTGDLAIVDFDNPLDRDGTCEDLSLIHISEPTRPY